MATECVASPMEQPACSTRMNGYGSNSGITLALDAMKDEEGGVSKNGADVGRKAREEPHQAVGVVEDPLLEPGDRAQPPERIIFQARPTGEGREYSRKSEL